MEREIDEKPEQREKEHEADMWEEVYGQEGVLERCGNGKKQNEMVEQKKGKG